MKECDIRKLAEEVQKNHNKIINKEKFSQIDVLIGKYNNRGNGCSHTGEGQTFGQKTIRPRIPDLSTVDKKKILDLVDVLAKTNEEKEKYSQQLHQQRLELQIFQGKITRMAQTHQHEIQQLHQQIVELKSNLNRSNSNKDSDIVVLKTQKEIEMKRLMYDHQLKIQNLHMQLKNELQNQKRMHEAETQRMQNRIQELENLAKKHMDCMGDKEKMANAIIEELEKDKVELEGKLKNYKNKLKAAVYAIQKLKTKVDSVVQDEKVEKCDVTTQTFRPHEESTCRNTRSMKQSARKIGSTHLSVPERAIISDLFFTKDSMTEVIDPDVYKPQQYQSERQRIMTNEKWWDHKK